MSFNRHKFIAMMLVFFLTASLMVTTSLRVGAEPSHDTNAASARAVNVQPTVPTIISATLSAGVLVVTGTAQAGATVNIYDANLHLLGTTVADANGNFSLTTTNTNGLVPGVSTVVASFQICILSICTTSPLGLPVVVLGGILPTATATSTATATATPTPPVLPAAPTIISATLNAGVLLVVGTAQAGATVSIYDASLHLLGTTVADVNGNFSLTTNNTNGIVAGTSLVVGTTTVCILNQCLVSLPGTPVLVIGVGTTPTATSTATTTRHTSHRRPQARLSRRPQAHPSRRPQVQPHLHRRLVATELSNIIYLSWRTVLTFIQPMLLYKVTQPILFLVLLTRAGINLAPRQFLILARTGRRF